MATGSSAVFVSLSFSLCTSFVHLRMQLNMVNNHSTCKIFPTLLDSFTLATNQLVAPVYKRKANVFDSDQVQWPFKAKPFSFCLTILDALFSLSNFPIGIYLQTTLSPPTHHPTPPDPTLPTSYSDCATTSLSSTAR
jgi:hypothetical protein